MKRKENEKFRLDTSHKSSSSLIFDRSLSQIYSQFNKNVISNLKLKIKAGKGPNQKKID